MISFIVISIILVAIAAYFIVPALLKSNYAFSDEYDDLNVTIAKERLKEIKLQRDNGEINEETFQQLHDELESVLALDLSSVNDSQIDNSSEQNVVIPDMKTKTAVIIAIAIPIVAAGLYSQLGNFSAATGNVAQATQQQAENVAQANAEEPQMSMEEAVAGLEKRMLDEPNNPDGWFMLARTYMSMKLYSKAKTAYEKTIAIVGEDPKLMLRYVDAVAMTEGGSLSGAAKPILDKLMTTLPNNPMVLWLVGTAESQQGNYKKALTSWYTLQPMLVGKTKDLEQLNKLVGQAEEQLGVGQVAALKKTLNVKAITADPVATTDTPVAANVGIVVNVSLDPALKDKVSDDDVLFIFAKALSGPPMPLAAVKKTVSALPLKITLDDTMAMMPQMKLSNFKQVKLSAVISKSGTPGKKAGDLFVEVFPVEVNTKDEIILIINQVK